MDQVEVTVTDSQYCRKCPSCRRQIRCDTLKELAEMFTAPDGQAFKSCQKCRDKRGRKNRTSAPMQPGFDLDECYETHEEFVEAVSSFLKHHDNHDYDASLPPLRIRASLSATFCIGNDVSIEACAQTTDRDLHKRAVMLLRSDIFDCSGYYFHLRHAHERHDGTKYSFGCPASVEHRPAVRDPSTVQRYTVQKEYFECHGTLQISFSQANASATVIYEHIGHTESRKFHMTDEVREYITSHKYLPPRQIYQNLMQMTSISEFEKIEAHILTKQQVYNFWISLTRGEWQRDAADDFKSAQLLVSELDGYELVEDLQEPGISLAFVTPCFTDHRKFNRTKMTEIFIDSTFGTNKHGFELYCVLAEYDLVSLPLSYLLLDTRGLQEDGKRGSRLTQWFMALRNAGLKPNFVHTDKDFAGMNLIVYTNVL
ncbi:hypothetical protein POJ06DRAFT_203943 [Lipomyces tetrasporus]|uniref:MULE transposase domain-containing protein n=1 Tax=Lipomyces tetrasporus TaxID=54092 RepID=A0AAD7QJR7_9ASCO|nr:uncharacterized protein POJ06DRAFT_203943 [Lipomyces tetrasporus]KAJ8096469.1 hypothetical protein POJ06DRAFT_203943 [Lipomyces tetrasporus]